MKNQNRSKLGGFTLIELLVVVLIIGVLASLAIPQYERSVERARVSKVWATMSSLNKAVKVARLEKPTGQIYFSDLSVNLTATGVSTLAAQDSSYAEEGFCGPNDACYSIQADDAILATYKSKVELLIRDGKRSCADIGGDFSSCAKLGFTKTWTGCLTSTKCYTE